MKTFMPDDPSLDSAVSDHLTRYGVAYIWSNGDQRMILEPTCVKVIREGRDGRWYEVHVPGVKGPVRVEHDKVEVKKV